MKIKLTEQLCGQVKTVVSLDIEEDTSTTDFFDELVTKHPELAKKLQTAMATITNQDHYINDQKFKHLGKGLYEIKAKGKQKAIRIYCFLTTIEGLPNPKLIVAGYCSYKPSQARQQNQQIQKAQKIQQAFTTAQESQETELEYIPLTSPTP